MCRQLFVHHGRCEHMSIIVRQCDLATSPLNTIYCENYKAARLHSDSSCAGSYCKVQEVNTERATFLLQQLRLDLSDLRKVARLHQYHGKVAALNCLQGNPVQRSREEQHLKQLKQEMKVLHGKRERLQHHIRVLRLMLGIGKPIAKELPKDPRTPSSQRDFPSTVLPTPSSLSRSPIRTVQPLAGTLEAANGDESLFGDIADVRYRSEMDCHSSPASPRSTRSGRNGNMATTGFDLDENATAAMRPVHARALSTTSQATSTLRIDVGYSPSDLVHSHPRRIALEVSNMTQRSRNRRRLRGRKEKRSEQTSMSIRRSGRLSGKDKKNYAESSDEERVELSDARAMSTEPRSRNPGIMFTRKASGRKRRAPSEEDELNMSSASDSDYSDWEESFRDSVGDGGESNIEEEQAERSPLTQRTNTRDANKRMTRTNSYKATAAALQQAKRDQTKANYVNRDSHDQQQRLTSKPKIEVASQASRTLRGTIPASSLDDHRMQHNNRTNSLRDQHQFTFIHNGPALSFTQTPPHAPSMTPNPVNHNFPSEAPAQQGLYVYPAPSNSARPCSSAPIAPMAHMLSASPSAAVQQSLGFSPHNSPAELGHRGAQSADDREGSGDLEFDDFFDMDMEG
ncbi:hypothetical protein AAFC00_000955 [Neodothiora populina]|uniref:Uncharacterized protein n=1 Tax=Neodothiora populina TaxID=2781224 RepID=A0ABR3PMB2_9PEZI